VIPEAELERIAGETGIGRWNLRFALYGRHEVVEAQLGTLATAFDHIAQSCFSYREYDGAAPEQAIRAGDKALAGIPVADVCQMTQWSGAAAGDFVTMSSTARLDAADVEAHYRLLRAGMESHGFDHHGMIVLFPRSVMHTCCIPFDKTVPALVEAAHRACDEVLAQAAAAGYGPLERLRGQAALSAYNDHSLHRLYAAVKDAVDPNGILDTGRRQLW
jgi:4-cresol dehydrogenase (hydroxylating)